MLAVVLTFDRFPLSLLGCYGNPVVKTPVFDRIAADSIVFDRHFGEDFSANPNGHAWWSGCRHFPVREVDSTRPSLVQVLRDAGVEAVWLTEDADSSLVPMPEDGELRRFSDGAEVIRQGAELLGEWSNDGKRSRLLWLKLGSAQWTTSDAAAAEVEAFDARLEPLWAAIRKSGESQPVLLIFTASRGLLLRDRAEMSEIPAEAIEESVHLPLTVYHSQQSGGERCFSFTQSTDLPATLLDFFAVRRPDSWEGESFLQKNQGGDLPKRYAITYGNQGVWEAIRAREFHLIRSEDKKNPGLKKHFLFLKPEDVWDWNDVSSQELEMTETLSQQLDASLDPAGNPLSADRAESQS